VTAETRLQVESDPRAPVRVADHEAKVAAVLELRAIQAPVEEARDDLERVVDGLDMVLATLSDEHEDLQQEGERLRASVIELQERHFTGPECQGSCGGPVTSRAVGAPMGRIIGESGAPAANTRVMIAQARAAADTITGDVKRLMDTGVASYRSSLIAAGYTPFGVER
jgi:hypothetical protein